MGLTIILFFVAVLATTDGLNCYGHICSRSQYCFIRIHEGTGSCYTARTHYHHQDHQLCIGSHHPGDHCYFHEQACVDSMARQTTTASSVATAAQTVGPGQTTDQVTTMGLSSTEGTTSLTLCANHEDTKFNCQDYNNHYSLCTALTPTLQNIAWTRCSKFCNLCRGNETAPTQSELTGSTIIPPCIDHDNRCSQTSYKNLLCNPNAPPDTKKYAIQTCPLTCNYCVEYLGPPCEDKMNCTILVASNMCNVPTVKNLCPKSCNHCSQVTVASVLPIG